MAAIDLSAYQIGDCYTLTTAAAWQEMTLPATGRTVTLITEGAVYLAPLRGGGTAIADGAAVGTHRCKLPANAVVTVPISGIRSIFLAQTSATEKVTLWFGAGSP